MSRSLVALLPFLAFGLRVHAQCPDYARTNYSVSGPTRAVAVGDFNDGSGDFAIFIGHGDGTFAAPVITASGIPFVWSVVVGDFNRDGKLDVIASNEGTVLAVLLGNGDGTFTRSKVTVDEADDL